MVNPVILNLPQDRSRSSSKSDYTSMRQEEMVCDALSGSVGPRSAEKGTIRS